MNNSDYFGGFMLWDAAWDQQNFIAGQMYSDYIADIISGETPTTPGISSTASGGTTVPTTAATTQTTSGFSSTVPPTVGPGNLAYIYIYIYIYPWIFENRVSKNINSFYYLAI